MFAKRLVPRGKMNREYSPRNDRYYEPPDEPDEAVCEGCQINCYFDDLEEVNGKWLCEECVKKGVEK